MKSMYFKLVIALTLFVSVAKPSQAQLTGQCKNFYGNRNADFIREQGPYYWVGAGFLLRKYFTANDSIIETYDLALEPGLNSVINCGTIDSHGNIWIGTELGGFGKLDTTTKAWTLYDSTSTGIYLNGVSALYVDSLDHIWLSNGFEFHHYNGVTWIDYSMTVGPSVYVIEYKGGDSLWIGTASNLQIFKHTTLGVSYPPVNAQINSINKDYQNDWWFGTSNGIYRYNGVSWINYNTGNSGIATDYIFDVAVTTSNDIYAASLSGLILKSGPTWSVYNTSNTALQGDDTYNVEFLGNKIVFSGFRDLGVLDAGNFSFTPTSNTTYNYNNLQKCCIDAFFNKWVTAPGDGVYRHAGGVWEKFNSTNFLTTDFATAVTSNDSGMVFIATNDGLFSYYNGTFIHYNTSNSGLPENVIHDIEMSGNGLLWVATDMEIASFDGTNWNVIPTGTSGIPNNAQKFIEVDDSNHVWVMINPAQLFTYNGTTWTNYSTSNSNMPNLGFGTALKADTDHNIWIGTNGDGVAKFDRDTTWHVYTSANSPLLHNNVWSLNINNYGEILIGTGLGLNLLDSATWYSYTMVNSGIPAYGINDICVDPVGNFWMTNQEALTAFLKYSSINSVENSIPVPIAGQLFIYPNPGSDHISISIPTENTSLADSDVSIYDQSGRLISTTHLGNSPVKTISVNINGLTPGMYFVIVTNILGNRITGKFVKR